MSSLFKCYLILLSSGMKLYLSAIQHLHYIIYSSYCFGLET